MLDGISSSGKIAVLTPLLLLLLLLPFVLLLSCQINDSKLASDGEDTSFSAAMIAAKLLLLKYSDGDRVDSFDRVLCSLIMRWKAPHPRSTMHVVKASSAIKLLAQRFLRCLFMSIFLQFFITWDR